MCKILAYQNSEPNLVWFTIFSHNFSKEFHLPGGSCNIYRLTQKMHPVHCNYPAKHHTRLHLQLHFVALLCCNSLLHFFVAILCCTSLLQFFVAILCCNSLLQFFVALLRYIFCCTAPRSVALCSLTAKHFLLQLHRCKTKQLKKVKDASFSLADVLCSRFRCAVLHCMYCSNERTAQCTAIISLRYKYK